MKIALYLGSFNPFHNGHLNVIETALNDFKMDKVIIVPSMQNPWKEEKPLDIDKRVEIIKKYILDIARDPKLPYIYDFDKVRGIYISLIEKKLISPYYSYATLHALKNKYFNSEVFVLCGEDTIKAIPDWMNGKAIIQDYNFLIVDRPKNAISSTQIREYIKLDKDITGFVSPGAVNLIKEYYK